LAEEKEVVLSGEISPNWLISFLTSIFSAPNSLFYLLGIAVFFLLFSSNKALSFESTEISGKHFESTQSTEILFVDYRVSDQEVLLSELRENTEVVFLNADSPGIEQIAAALKGRGKVAAHHVLSHGAPGSVLIGSDQLNLAALTSSASGSVKKLANISRPMQIFCFMDAKREKVARGDVLLLR